MMSIADQIVTYRAINRLTQRELAEKLGVGRNSIPNWESGKDLSRVALALLKMAGVVSVDTPAPKE